MPRLFTYFTMNVAFSGVPVPSGNFTGTMMIGGLAGRLIGHWLSQLFPDSGLARSGIYSMIGRQLSNESLMLRSQRGRAFQLELD